MGRFSANSGKTYLNCRVHVGALTGASLDLRRHRKVQLNHFPDNLVLVIQPLVGPSWVVRPCGFACLALITNLISVPTSTLRPGHST